MARVRTKINTDLSEASINRRQKTNMHGTAKKGVDRSKIAATAKHVGLPADAQKIEVPVSECRVWSYNDRIYDGLNMENCKSLVDDIEKNGQLQPVVARLDPTGKSKYEIIIGTRRFWACQHTINKTIKLAVIEADDKHAYRMMRSENAQRNDTTAYEKAINAKRVISEIYHGSQKEYCLENDIPEQTLSDWMAIADMEPEVVAAIPDMFEVTVKQSTKLRSLVNKSVKSKKAILDKAAELKGTSISTREVLKELIKAGEGALKPKTRSTQTRTYSVADDQKGLTVKRDAKGVITVKISKKAATQPEAIVQRLKEYLAG